MTILLLTFAILLLMGIPIAYSLGMASATYFVMVQPELLPVLPQRLFAGMQSYALIALPLFIFMGQLMNSSGITQRLVDLCLVFVGRFSGGLGMVNVSTSMLFGGISGSATSDTASIGSVLIPEMKKRGYPLSYASGITVASSTMGMILPPSIPMVLYAVSAQVSVGKLFLGGIIPGLLVGILQLGIAVWISKRNHYPKETTEGSWKRCLLVVSRSVHILIMPVFVVGVVVFGIATATESAALGGLYALGIGIFFMRFLTLKTFYASMLSAARTSAYIMIIIAFSQVFVWILALERAPESMTQFMLSLQLSPTLLMLLIVAIVLVIGTVIDVSPAILLLTPIFLPVVTEA
ncbi:MAG: TRAP transporter large permease, partial [Verrucomicrobia bacterium]|nr:TRAP transporter large permease [Verrucomicrobiota bacterium]